MGENQGSIAVPVVCREGSSVINTSRFCGELSVLGPDGETKKAVGECVMRRLGCCKSPGSCSCLSDNMFIATCEDYHFPIGKPPKADADRANAQVRCNLMGDIPKPEEFSEDLFCGNCQNPICETTGPGDKVYDKIFHSALMSSPSLLHNKYFGGAEAWKKELLLADLITRRIICMQTNAERWNKERICLIDVGHPSSFIADTIEQSVQTKIDEGIIQVDLVDLDAIEQ